MHSPRPTKEEVSGGTLAGREPNPHRGASERSRERELLLELLAQQQRIAQAGLVTSGLSHDVGNHVQCIMGAATIALRHNDPRAWKRALKDIETQCLVLAETTNAFLDFVKREDAADQGAFSVVAAVEQARRVMWPLAKKSCVELDIVSDPPAGAFVLGESRSFVQCLVNLLSNAIRAVSAGSGHVAIEVTSKDERTCRVQVSDDGPGIPEDLRRHIFRPFATGHGDNGGNGLGLFIVRQLVRKLGGSIQVRTSRAGTTFFIDLPLARRRSTD